MKEFNHNQWDDKYPVTEHFEEDIETETLYVLDVDDKICGFIILSTKINQSGMMTLNGQ